MKNYRWGYWPSRQTKHEAPSGSVSTLDLYSRALVECTIKDIYFICIGTFTSMHNSIKFSLITLTAIVASMVSAPSAVVTVQAQGGSSMSGMNMSGTKMSAIPPMPGQTIVRDSVTLLLAGQTIPPKGFIHVYDAAPYMIHDGHVALHVPCDTSSKLVVNLLVGQVNGTFIAIQPTNIKQLSQPGQMCLSHVNINSDMTKKFYLTDVAIQNPSNQTIIFPPTSTVIVGVNGIMPNP
jgi:hypothetical protein